ncbi:hypothetical protein [Maliponia aquimaris]|nr:hypothetical protein [Maliponia aquimaris]
MLDGDDTDIAVGRSAPINEVVLVPVAAKHSRRGLPIDVVCGYFTW